MQELKFCWPYANGDNLAKSCSRNQAVRFVPETKMFYDLKRKTVKYATNPYP